MVMGDNQVVLVLSLVRVPYGRDAKTYKRANNVCVNVFLAWVKSVQDFTLFCLESEQCRDFALISDIFWHIVEPHVTFLHFLGL